METQVQNEITFYQDPSVTVTQSRYVTNSRTTIPILMVIVGTLLLIAEDSRVPGFIILAIGILLLVLIKNEFAVRISTNSGEVNSVVSKDRLHIQKIVNALNEAIIHRG
eukprot:gene11074-12905_t